MGNKNRQLLHTGIALSVWSDCNIGRRGAVGKAQLKRIEKQKKSAVLWVLSHSHTRIRLCCGQA